MSKKSSSKSADEITYEVRDVVLAKIRGYPAWPAQVVDAENVPKEVAKERPAGKKSTFYCVRFFPAGDHAWVPPRDLSKLKTEEIDAYINEPHKKNGDLLVGYRVARDPTEWEREMENKREAAEEAEAAEEVDELDGEEEADEDEQPAKAKKRKRESESAPKTKAKPKKDKEAGETTSKKKKASEKADKPAKSKKNGAKSKEMVESEDEGGRGERGGSSKKASPPPTKKTKHDKEEEGDDDLDSDPQAAKVKEMRHKLQRSFLGKTVPKPEDMSGLDAVFTQVEQHDMSIKYLQYSKIGKVMRHIAALEDDRVPRDNEFKIKERAQALVNKWHSAFTKQSNGIVESTRGALTEPPASTANGDAPQQLPAQSDIQVLHTDVVPATEENASDEKPEAQRAVGDMTLGESVLGDVTMSEVAA